MISLVDFKKLDLRVAKIISAQRVENSEKLVKLEIAAGDTDESGAPKNRQLIAGIGRTYLPENLINKEIVIAANLEPKIITLRGASGQMGLESQGMLLAANCDGNEPALLIPEKPVPAGTEIK